MALTYVNIATQTLSSTQTSITFSSIPQTYTDLVLRCSPNTSTDERITRLYFNGDTSAVYSFTRIGSSATAVSTDRAFSAGNVQIGDVRSVANIFNLQEMYIPSYRVSQNKVFNTYNGMQGNDLIVSQYLMSNLYRNTSAITSVTVFPTAGTYSINSTFYLYGILRA